jgi:hypothetical protein
MAKFRVSFEASAAIGIEVEIEAEDEDSARHTAEARFDQQRQAVLIGIAEGLCKPDPEAVKGYADTSGLPITFVTCELDENGFEVVDTFPAESIAWLEATR